MNQHQESRLVAVERDMDWLKQAILEIKDNTGRLVEVISKMQAMEQKHQEATRTFDRVFLETAEQNRRITCIEHEMPTLEMMRGWFFGAVIWALSTSGGLVYVIIRGH